MRIPVPTWLTTAGEIRNSATGHRIQGTDYVQENEFYRSPSGTWYQRVQTGHGKWRALESDYLHDYLGYEYDAHQAQWYRVLPDPPPDHYGDY